MFYAPFPETFVHIVFLSNGISNLIYKSSLKVPVFNKLCVINMHLPVISKLCSPDWRQLSGVGFEQLLTRKVYKPLLQAESLVSEEEPSPQDPGHGEPTPRRFSPTCSFHELEVYTGEDKIYRLLACVASLAGTKKGVHR